MTLAAIVADRLLEWPARSELVYRVARRIVNRWRGENDSRMGHNGELRLMRQILPSGTVAFDVGANSGEWAEEALRVNPTLNLHCFEPNSSAFERLQHNVLGSNVVLNKFGLGERKGSLDLYVYGEGAEVNSLYNRAGVGLAPLRTESAELSTLDAYCDERGIESVDFIKIDVEGHELSVLKGAHGLLKSGRIRALQFEYSGCYIDARVFLKDVWDFLSETNDRYRLFKILPHGLLPVGGYRQEFENLQYSNYLAVHDQLPTGVKG